MFKTTIMIFYFLFIAVLSSKAFKGTYEKFIFTIILLTLPNIEYLKYTVEPAIWTFIIFSSIGSIFIVKKEIKDFFYFNNFSGYFLFFKTAILLNINLNISISYF